MWIWSFRIGLGWQDYRAHRMGHIGKYAWWWSIFPPRWSLSYGGWMQGSLLDLGITLTAPCFAFSLGWGGGVSAPTEKTCHACFSGDKSPLLLSLGWKCKITLSHDVTWSGMIWWCVCVIGFAFPFWDLGPGPQEVLGWDRNPNPDPTTTATTTHSPCLFSRRPAPLLQSPHPPPLFALLFVFSSLTFPNSWQLFLFF